MNKSEIMKKAWEIKKLYFVSMSSALKVSWHMSKDKSDKKLSAIDRMMMKHDIISGIKIIRICNTGDNNTVEFIDEKTGNIIVKETENKNWKEFNFFAA